MAKIKVGILGATGMVGQRFISLLENHPWFEVGELAASPNSAGKTYAQVVSGRWKMPGDIPKNIADTIVKSCDDLFDCQLLFSSLSSEVAGDVESRLAEKGHVICSNSKNHRMDPDVPLIVPEVNADHLALIESKATTKQGFIITNPNCVVIPLSMVLKPLNDAFGVEKVVVTSMQAISGAGIKGFDLDIHNNIIPYINDEEPKLVSEPLKILSSISDDKKLHEPSITISPDCNRVNVLYGHTECVSVIMKNKPRLEDIRNVLESFDPLAHMDLPSAPHPPLVFCEGLDHPQPKYDSNKGDGMSVSVGKLRQDALFDAKFTILSHNTIRGAAGAALLNAELLKVKGYLQ